MPEPTYQIVFFGSQRIGNPPRFSHTWAIIQKQSPSSSRGAVLAPLAISWLPESLDIKFRGPPEPGKNFNHRETMDWVRAGRAQVKYWGPFAATKELFDLCEGRIRQLNSGELRYVMLDRRYRPHEATNCIHAVSDLDLAWELLDTDTLRGFQASKKVLDCLKKRGLVLGAVTPSPVLAELLEDI